jgi:hypothetical protein
MIVPSPFPKAAKQVLRSDLKEHWQIGARNRGTMKEE